MNFAQYLTESIETYYHVTPTSNVPSILLKGIIPAIGALSKEGGEDDKRIYLFKSKEDVEEGWMNWMEQYFGDDEPMTVLKVTIPDNTITIDHDGFEYTTMERIAGQYVSDDSGITI